MRYLAIFLTALAALAGEVRLAWDPNPVGEQVLGYYVYEGVGPITTTNGPLLSSTNWTIDVQRYTNIAFVTTTNAVLSNVLAGPHLYVVTASNWWGESIFSNPAQTAVQPYPSVPSRLEIQVFVPTNTTARLGFEGVTPAVDVEHSADLVTWHSWLQLRQLDSDLTVSNFHFTVWADEPKSFWRMVRR